MKVLKKLITRARIAVLLLVTQIVIIVPLFNRILLLLPVIAIISYAISILIVLFLIKKNEAAVYKVTWILVVMGLPISGGILYLLFGNKRPAKKVAAKMEKHALVTGALRTESSTSVPQSIPDERMAVLAKYIQQSSAYPAYANTQTKYYPMGDVKFEDMLTELRTAEKFIFLEYFIISKGHMWNQILEILTEKAKTGVDVRLIVDDLGSISLFTRRYVAKLRESGIKVVRFNPIKPRVSLFMNYRNHRKILVVDGHTAFTGGINIADEYIGLDDYLGVWKDNGIRLKGEAVWSFTLMFIETWEVFCLPDEKITDYTAYKNTQTKKIESDGAIIPFGDSPLGKERLAENIYIDILSQAKHYAYIFTPYLIISEKMIYALQMAARRGVDVRIVTPGIADKKVVFRLTRSYYSYMHEAGIKVYEYSPGFLHAKGFVCDDEIAVVGTINLDYRSLYLHFECAALLYGSTTVKDVKDDVLATIAESREVLPVPKKRMFWNGLLDAVLHLFAPLL